MSVKVHLEALRQACSLWWTFRAAVVWAALAEVQHHAEQLAEHGGNPEDIC